MEIIPNTSVGQKSVSLRFSIHIHVSRLSYCALNCSLFLHNTFQLRSSKYSSIHYHSFDNCGKQRKDKLQKLPHNHLNHSD